MPQGPIIGPVLLNIFMSDIFRFIKDSDKPVEENSFILE